MIRNTIRHRAQITKIKQPRSIINFMATTIYLKSLKELFNYSFKNNYNSSKSF